MKDAIILTNITDYFVTDIITENLMYKAQELCINEFLCGASSIPQIREKAKKFHVSLSAAIAYPSGAYFPDAKAEEITELIELFPEIKAFYVVVSLGMYLGHGAAWLREELESIKHAAHARKIYIISEIAPLLKNGKAEEFVRLCGDYGVSGIVVSTGFAPYKASFPSEADIRAFSAISGEKLELICTGIDPHMALNAGCVKVLAGFNAELL